MMASKVQNLNFIVNRPFYYAIRNIEDVGAPLFEGHLANPPTVANPV